MFKIGILGLGYVGLPLAIEFGKKYQVIGYDKKAKRIVPINRGLIGSLYDLTYPSTKVLDRLYLGNSYNARDYYDLEKILTRVIGFSNKSWRKVANKYSTLINLTSF